MKKRNVLMFLFAVVMVSVTVRAGNVYSPGGNASELNKGLVIYDVPIIPLVQPDLIIQTATVTSRTASYVTFDYTIKNIGKLNAELKNICVDIYVSKTLPSDISAAIPAGFFTIGILTGSLEPGGTYSNYFSFSPTAAMNFSEYKYLILKVSTPATEWCTANNFIGVPIE